MRMRIFRVAMAYVAICIAAASSAADVTISSIDEATYLQRVAKAPRMQALDSRTLAAHYAIGAASVRPNPTLSYEREGVADVFNDQFVRLSLPVDLAFRRKFLGSAASAGAEAELELVRDSDTGLQLDARHAFLDAIYLREYLARLDAARAALSTIVDALRTRAQQGDTSSYDFDRASLELDLVDDERATATRELDIARLKLGAFVGEPSKRYDAIGPLEMPTRRTTIDTPSRGNIDAARARERQAKHELAFASRGWVPKVELMGGLLISQDASTTRYGAVMGVSAEIPIFDAGGAAKTKARAEAKRWRAEAEALSLEVTAEVEQARRDLALRIDQAEAYAKGPATRAFDLQKRAAVAYREGDRTILELLDVQRTARTSTVHLLKLTYEARRAEIALLRALGRTQ